MTKSHRDTCAASQISLEVSEVTVRWPPPPSLRSHLSVIWFLVRLECSLEETLNVVLSLYKKSYTRKGSTCCNPSVHPALRRLKQENRVDSQSYIDGSSLRGPRYISQHPESSSWAPITPFPGDWTSSSGLHEHCTCKHKL